MEKKYNFIMMIGLPGSGKSTLIETEQRRITAGYGIDTVIGSDMIIDDVAAILGKTYNEVFDDVIKYASTYSDTFLSLMSYAKKNFILDQTNLNLTQRRRRLGLLKNYEEYNKIAVVFQVPDEELKTRLEKRKNEQGKTIPERVLREMKDSFIYPTTEEGFDKVMTVEEFIASLPTNQKFDDGVKFG